MYKSPRETPQPTTPAARPVRPVASSDPLPALQPSHRTNPPVLGSVFHPLGWPVTPTCHERSKFIRILIDVGDERKVSASTYNQALSALLLLYREVMEIDLPWLQNINRPTQPKRIPAV